MTNEHILVIGAGIGGIATAARLARHGYRVTVVEKGTQAGGRCDRLVRDGHTFDTGPTLFLFPDIFAQTFKDLGECMADHLELRRVDPGYHVHFGDGSTLRLTSDLDRMQAQLEAIEPGSFDGYLRYLDEARLHYELAIPKLIGRNFRSFAEQFNPRMLRLMYKVKLLTKHYTHMGKYFQDPRLKAAFTFQDMYLSLSPFEASATYSLFQYTEFADGVWLPKGGMYSLIEALTAIAEKRGVRFLYNAPVERINVANRRATGVTLANGQQLQADIVVANADLPYVYRCLLPDDNANQKRVQRLARKKYTYSAVMFYWGVDRQYPQFAPHNIFLADHYQQGFERVLSDHALPDEPTVYMHTPVQIDPTMAPAGHDTLVVVVPVGHITETAPQEWDAIQDRARQIVLQRLSQIGAYDLQEHIKFEVSFTPLDWQSRYNLTNGSTLGLGHNLSQLGYLRPHNRHEDYHNLYFVGASTHPGAGLPSSLLSAQFATERILQDVGAPLGARSLTPATAAPSRV